MATGLVTIRRLFRKLYYQTLSGGTQALWMLSSTSDYYVLTFDGIIFEQLYSVQSLPSCTNISISLFNKTLNHNYIQATFSKLFVFKWIFLWLQMLSMPLKKGDFWETHAAWPLALIHYTCSSNRQSEPKVPTQTHQLHYPASRTSFSDTITSSRKTEVVLKLSNVPFAEFFTSTAKI